MKTLRALFIVVVVPVLCLIIAVRCNGKRQMVPADGGARHTKLDTAVIEGMLRRHRALSPTHTAREASRRNILRESIAMGYNDQTCYLLMDFGSMHADRGNFDSVLFYYNKAKEYCNKPLFDKTLPATYLTEFGAFYHTLRSDYVSANKSYYEALSYLKANGLTENQLTINLYIYLVGTQVQLGHYDQALHYLNEAEKLAIRLGSKQALMSVHYTFGNFYFERKDFRMAEKYYDLALAITWEPHWHPNMLISALVGKGSVLAVKGEADKALPVLKRALQVARSHRISYSEAGVSIELGAAYNTLGQYEQTIQLLTGVLKTSEYGFGWKTEDGYRTLMAAYEGLGRYKEALDFQRKLHALSDSNMSAAKAAALNQLEVRFQTANKDKEIASKQLQIEQQKNRIARNNILIAGISGIALFALIILIAGYRLAKHRENVQKLEMESMRTAQEIALLKSTMQGEEQERKRLSRELHDGIGSMLFSAIMRISLLKKQDPKSVSTEDFNDILVLLEQTGSEVRKTAQNMMPDIINKLTLFEAIQSYCETIAIGTNVKIDVLLYGDPCEFPANVKLVVYRIVQELVHNVVKHSNATQAIVQGVQNEDHFTITVEDNGNGFDMATARSGLGLKNVETRVKSLYGDFQIDTTPGGGTTVYLEFDCHRLQGEVE